MKPLYRFVLIKCLSFVYPHIKKICIKAKEGIANYCIRIMTILMFKREYTPHDNYLSNDPIYILYDTKEQEQKKELITYTIDTNYAPTDNPFGNLCELHRKMPLRLGPLVEPLGPLVESYGKAEERAPLRLGTFSRLGHVVKPLGPLVKPLGPLVKPYREMQLLSEPYREAEESLQFTISAHVGK